MRETDVGQMLTAGVSLEAVGGVSAFGCGGGAEAGVEDTDPPRVCTHTHTHTHTHTLGWVWRTIPPFKMLPRQVLPASWKGRGNHLSIFPQIPPPEQEDEAGVNSLMSFSPSSVSRPARPRGHLQGQAWTGRFVKLVQPCHFCISVAPCYAGVGVCELFSHVQLCDPMDCSPPDASVHGIFQGRILEWVAMPFSKASSQLRD